MPDRAEFQHPAEAVVPLPAPLQQRFESLGLLGQGNMGAVFRARERASGQVVALKVLSAPSERARERLMSREGQLTAKLRHPGIIGIHAAGDAEGVPFPRYAGHPQADEARGEAA